MGWASGSHILLEHNKGTKETIALKVDDEGANTVINSVECETSRHLDMTVHS